MDGRGYRRPRISTDEIISYRGYKVDEKVTIIMDKEDTDYHGKQEYTSTVDEYTKDEEIINRL